MISKADLHVHTSFSLDSFSSPKKIAHRAIKKGIRVLAIADHLTIKGAEVLKKYVEKHKLPLEIITGEEIYTLSGHVVGFFLRQHVPSHQSLEETVRQIKEQGGFAIIPHISFEEPKEEMMFRSRVSYVELINKPKLLKMIDGIEVTNFTLFERDYETKARFINEKFLKKAEIGSSDAHIVRHVGKSYTFFEGETAEDLKKAIAAGKTKAFIIPWLHTAGDVTKNFAPAIKLPFYFAARWTAQTYQTCASTVRKIFYKSSLDQR